MLALLATGSCLYVANSIAHQFQAIIFGPLQIPFWLDLDLSLRSVFLALGLAVFCAVAASMVPALKATGRGIQSNLQRSAGRGSPIRFGAGSTALIVAEVAISVGVLSAGTAQMRTVFQDTTGEMGIELEHYLSAQLQIPFTAPTAGQADTYLDDFWDQVGTTQLELKRRIVSEPGVLSVAMGRDLPGMDLRQRMIEVEGDIGSRAEVAEAIVDVDFFRDMGHPTLDGRGFSSGDIPEERGAHREAVIVNTTFVEQVLGGGRRESNRRYRWLRLKLGGGVDRSRSCRCRFRDTVGEACSSTTPWPAAPAGTGCCAPPQRRSRASTSPAPGMPVGRSRRTR